MRKLWLIMLLSVLLLGSCAYYNTFYNTRKQFKKAEEAYQAKPPETEVSSSQREQYEQAIKKAAKILAFYPNSKYVDDALFLMGKSYFRMEEFGKARRKFEELLANYPQTQFRFEAGYLLGTIHYYMDDQTRARDALMAVIESSKKNSWADNARYMLGEMAFWSGDYKTAAEEYRRVAEDYPGSELRAGAVFMTGECYFKTEKYAEALAAYQEAKRFEYTTSQRYQIDLRVGECYRKLGQLDQALETFQDLAGSDRYVDHLPEINLRISEVHYLMGDTTDAIGRYEDIVRQNEKTSEAAWAYYQLGLISMEGFSDLEKAKEYFDKSKSESPASEAAQLASLRRNQIGKLEEYRQKAAAADSAQLAAAHFSLAEVYLLDLSRPDSALTYYRKVLQESPKSGYAPRSAYASAWILENTLGDTAASRQMYQHIIDSYPYSESANAARRRLSQPTVVDSAGQDVAERFLRAEELMLREHNAGGALAEYDSILAEYPQSLFAPKAQCAIAWILEYMMGNRDSAMVVFQHLAQEYPDSECGLLAQKIVTPPPPPAIPDTISAETAGDSTALGRVQKPAEKKPDEKAATQDDEDEGERRPIERRPETDESAPEQ